MNEVNLVKGALTDVLEGSDLFGMIKVDIDGFIEKYGVAHWLSLNQVSTIHEILMSGDRSRLDEYRKLQLRRQSEKERWQREVDGKKAINYFYEMVDELLNRYLPSIKDELEERFRLSIDDSYNSMIYQSLIKIFDYIFITEIRTLKRRIYHV